MVKAIVYALLGCAGVVAGIAETRAAVRYDVPPVEGDATRVLQAVIDRAAQEGGNAVINLSAGAEYNVYRTSATEALRFISNTTSERENPDNTKHIALYFHNTEGITFNGNGASIVTHGELTAFAVEQCRDITLENFILDAADPSVPEFTVVAATPRSVRVRVTEPSRYEITPDSTFFWVGEGWRFTDGLAQVYLPGRKMTLRHANPIARGTRAVEIKPGVVDLFYDEEKPFKVGEVYQMRHTIRNEVCGFINESTDITLTDIDFRFVGNFGVVSQNSSGITIADCRMAPAPDGRRTCAGFADFLQFSGCRGHIEIANCYFAGAHDDAINVHGTHLRIMEQPQPDRLRVRYMHDQTRGFNSFYPGDTIETVNVHTLTGTFAGRVTGSERLDDYEWLLTLDRDVEPLDLDGGYAVENISATPSLRVAGCYFTLVPTRGILVTTRRKVEIVDNLFENIPMPAIYVSDDARGWYESGPVRDMTVNGNKFIGCSAPVIQVNPENDSDGGAVHSGIRITGNEFVGCGQGDAVSLRGAADITVENNTIKSL